MPTEDGKVVIYLQSNAKEIAADFANTTAASNGLERAIKNLTNSQYAFTKSQNALATQYKLQENLDAVRKSAQATFNEFQKLSDSKSSFAALQTATRGAEEGLRTLALQGKTNTKEFRQLQELVLKNKDALNQAKLAVDGNTKSNKLCYASLIQLRTALTGAALYGLKKLSDALINIPKQVIDTAASFEQLSVSFRVMTGSAELGQQLTDQIIQLAKVTPMTTQGLSKNTQTLLGFGESAENVIEDLKLLGDISGGNQQRMDYLALAFAQAGAAGRLLGQDARQMINQGFNPLQVISEKTGKSMSQLQDEMSKGQISFSMVKEAMREATSEGGRYYGLMNEQSKTLNGLMSTNADNWEIISKKIGDKFLPAAKLAQKAMIKLGDAVLRLIELSEPVSINYEGTLKGLQVQADRYRKIIEGNKSNNLNNNLPERQLAQIEAAISRTKEQIKLQEEVAKNVATAAKKGSGFQNSSGDGSKGKKGITTYVEQLRKDLEVQQDIMQRYANAPDSDPFIKAKASAVELTKKIETLKNATSISIHPFEELQHKIQLAQTRLNDFAASGDMVNTQRTRNEVIALTKKFEEVQRAAHIEISPFNELNYRLSEEKRILADLTAQWVIHRTGSLAAIYEQKNAVKGLENQLKQTQNFMESLEGLDLSNVWNSLQNDFTQALTTPLKEGENALERFSNLAINTFQAMAQEITKSLIIAPAVEKFKELFMGMTAFKGVTTGAAAPMASLAADSVKAGAGTSLLAAAITKAAPAMIAAAPAMAASSAAMAPAAAAAAQLGASLTQAAISQAALTTAMIPFVGGFLAPVAATATGVGIGAGNVAAAGGMALSRLAGKFAKGGVFEGGNVIPFAQGGVVDKPTYFPMQNGAGLMGEAGKESIMPLKRMQNGDLGVQAQNQPANVNVYNYTNAKIETIRRPNNDVDMKIMEFNSYLNSDRSNEAFSGAMSRNGYGGVAAA
ncbi:MAG: tape measure protein [Heliobacteriaceae bacterium]|nr:tape measure protein [Heliobacteriaceae bacterium]